MRNLFVSTFGALTLLVFVGCAPSSPSHQLSTDPNSLQSPSSSLEDRVRELSEGEKFVSSEGATGSFDTPFEWTYDEEGKITELTAKNGITEHTYSSSNSIEKGDVHIFVPNWWNENATSDVNIFLFREEYGEIHQITSEMMKKIYDSRDNQEQTLADLDYDFTAKAAFSLPIDPQASTSVSSSDLILYWINDESKLQIVIPIDPSLNQPLQAPEEAI